MSNRPTVGLYHDTRRPLDNGKFTVFVRVTFKVGLKWKQYYFTTGVGLSPDEWERVKEGKVRRELRALRSRIMNMEKDARDKIDKEPFITPQRFEAVFTGKASQSTAVRALFDELVTGAEKEGRISTAGSYRDSANALTAFGGEGLTLNEIDKDFLQRFDKEMRRPYKMRYQKKDPDKKETVIDRPGRSSTTIGIYLRNLRTVFNLAIERRLISPEVYPFGRKRYNIPSSRNVKKALNDADKTKLIKFKAKTPAAARALAAWTFSYYCNGMNFSDMAHIRKENIRGDVLTFRRNKTVRTKTDVMPVIVMLRKETLEILRHQVGDPYLFGVIDEQDSPARRKARIHQWIKTTNEQLAKICKELDIERVTTYTARHTAATTLLRGGRNLVDIRDALGHSSVKTTENYLASLNLEEKRKMSELL